MEDWYVYSGVANSGQNRLWQHRFREFFTRALVDATLTTETEEVLTTESNDELEVTIWE